MSLQIPILGDLTGLQAALRNVPGMVGNALQQANVAGRSAFSGLFGGLRSTVASFSSFLSSSLVNAVGAVGIVQSFRSTIQQLDRVGDLSQRFGVSADALQRLGGVAELSGGSMEGMARALSRLGRTTTEALLDPTGEAAKKFEALGIQAESLRGKGLEEVFLSVSQNISELSSEAEQGAAAFSLFGKAGDEVVLVAQLGRDGIAQLSSGLAVATDESVRSAQAIDDAFKTLGQNFRTTIGSMIQVLDPFIKFFLKAANVTAAGLNILVTGGLGLIGKASSQQFEDALEAAKRADANNFENAPTGVSSIAPARPRTLRAIGNEQNDPDQARDRADAVRARIDSILSSGRGLEAPQIIADSLAKIGGGGGSVLVAGSDREQQRLLAEQLKALQKIEKNTGSDQVARLK
jgi:hypothetical protein